MSEPMPCGQAVCPLPCQGAPLSLAEVAERFEREAERGVVDTGRYRCAYYVWGQGPPLVFVHGMADAARAYLPMAARLAGGFRCVAYELPCGRGDGARLRRYTHEQLVADLFALLDHLGIRQSYVLGSSFGSTVALAAMHAQPERIPRGILVGGFAHLRLAPAEILLARFAQHWPGSMRRLPFHAAVSRRAFGAVTDPAREMWDYFLENIGSAPIRAVARRAVMIHGLDLRPLLPAIRQPVLIVCGNQDALVSHQCGEELLRGLPNAGRVELPDCGHMTHYSHAEALAEVVRRFLTPPGQAGACGEQSCQAPCTNA